MERKNCIDEQTQFKKKTGTKKELYWRANSIQEWRKGDSTNMQNALQLEKRNRLLMMNKLKYLTE